MATTVPGGRYRRTDGVLVNAFGEPIEEPTPSAPLNAESDGKVDEDGPTVTQESTASGPKVDQPAKPTRKPRAKRK